MKAIDIRTAPPFLIRNDKGLGIQTYGEANNFPQLVRKIVSASCTGKSCLGVYRDFVYGRGFANEDIASMVVGADNKTLNEILKLAADDFCEFNAFALHVNYNAHCNVVEVNHVPLEHLRFEKLDENGSFNRIAEHDDWGREFEGLKKFKKTDIKFYHFFNPNPVIIEAQVDEAGGWSEYQGQIEYYSGAGSRTYSTPIYEPELTDMRTEEGLANVTGRNVTNNFLTAGAIVDINNSDESEQETNATKNTILNFQGDEKAGQLLYLQVESENETPKFISFRGENYDKDFSVTQQVIPNNIGRVFNQPPILRAQDVGANFGADLMVNAYNYYNAKTSGERLILKTIFKKVMMNWVGEVPDDFTIQPLSYNAGDTYLDRLGKDNVAKIYEIIKDPDLDKLQKRSMLKLMYGLNEDEITLLVPHTIKIDNNDSDDGQN